MAKACFHFMRVILVIISLIFMLLGLAVVAVSIFLKLAPPLAEISGDAGYPLSIALYVLIGLGAFMAIFGFIGCFGACRKSTACLGIYITILLIIIIAEIAVGIFLVIKTQFLVEVLDSQFDKLVKGYKENDKSPILDLIQNEGFCCGSNSFNDYSGVTLPASCCAKSVIIASTCTKAQVVNVPGCKKRIKNLISQKGFSILIGTILGIAGVEFIGIAFAIAICCHSRRQDAGYVSVVT